MPTSTLFRCLLASLSLMALSAFAQELPQYAEQKHLGVATCGNSTCHSVPRVEEPSNVRQDEHQTWLLLDRHSKAYNTLLSKESQRIANKLGLKDAHTADICLDCHADNVAAEKRGDEFHMSDGVGCEACHGGSEKWISSHTVMPYDYARNIADGMFPTANLIQRTRLCASCHIGNEQKMATHDIMGAGHPRLSFELDTFAVRQPEHYLVDADYLQRKGNDNNVVRLLIGAAVQAQWVAVNLTNRKMLDTNKGHPELALFDCHSCHHSLNDVRGGSRPGTTDLSPGTVRLNDSSFLLLSALVGGLDGDLQSNISSGIRSLHNASNRSLDRMQNAADKLGRLAQQAQQAFQTTTITNDHKQRMLREILKLGARGGYRDYVAAEQAIMLMDGLSYSLPTNPGLQQFLDKAYALTKNDETYRAGQFQRELRNFLKSG